MGRARSSRRRSASSLPFEATHFAAIGPATRRPWRSRESTSTSNRARARSADLAAQLPVNPGDRVLDHPGGPSRPRPGGQPSGTRRPGRRRDRLPDARSARSIAGPAPPRHADGPFAAVVFTSGSTVRGLVALGRDESIDVRSLPASASVRRRPTRQAGRDSGLWPSPRRRTRAALAAATAHASGPTPQEIS